MHYAYTKQTRERLTRSTGRGRCVTTRLAIRENNRCFQPWGSCFAQFTVYPIGSLEDLMRDSAPPACHCVRHAYTQLSCRLVKRKVFLWFADNTTSPRVLLLNKIDFLLYANP